MTFCKLLTPFSLTPSAFLGGLGIGLLSLGPVSGSCQKLTIPTSAPMAVELVRHVPLKSGQTLQGRLLYPVYENNQLAIPAGSTLQGSIVSLTPDKKQRLQARLQGDFTPFRKPVVVFRELTLPDGKSYQISTGDAANGAPTLHLTAAAPHSKRAFVMAQFDAVKQSAKDQAALITKPGRGDRIVQFLYRQLPYHPQRIETGTVWNVNLATPLVVAESKPASTAKGATGGSGTGSVPQPTAAKVSTPSAEGQPELLDAYLMTTISSATSKRGDTFQAFITQPVYSSTHQLMVPEGAVLIGTVTQAQRARRFGRRGKLRFNFREMQMPGGAQQNVDGMLAAADAAKGANLQIDSEGGVQPKSQGRVIVPLVLSALASRAFDNDGSQAANSTVASNGFGIVGRITGIVSGPPEVAAGIGFYGVGLSVFNRWIARGQDVTFSKDTRIQVLTTPARDRLTGVQASAKSGRDGTKSQHGSENSH